MGTGSQIFRFGRFEFDSSRRILNRATEVVWLPDRHIDAALILAFQRRKSVSKEALKGTWRDVASPIDSRLRDDPVSAATLPMKHADLNPAKSRRPREAWTDPADPLNHRVPAVQITNEPMNGVLVGLSNLIFYNQFTLEPRAMRETLVSFPMKAGTIIDALNQLAEQAGQIMWVAYARPRDNPDGWNVCQTPGSCHSALRFDLRSAEHMTGFVATQPWAKKGNP